MTKSDDTLFQEGTLHESYKGKVSNEDGITVSEERTVHVTF